MKVFIRFFYGSKSTLRSWLLGSDFFRLLLMSLEENFYSSQKKVEPTKAQIQDLVSEVFELEKAHNFKSLFYVLPSAMKDPKMSLAPLLEELNMNRVNRLHDQIHGEYSEKELSEYFFDGDPWHYTEKGHRFFGEKIYQILKRELAPN